MGVVRRAEAGATTPESNIYSHPEYLVVWIVQIILAWNYRFPVRPEDTWTPLSSIRDPMLINRLYVVNGNSKLLGETPLKGVAPYPDVTSYPTDPQFYGLEIKEPLLFRHVRAYREVDDAVTAVYRCGLEPYGSMLMVFRRAEGSWVYDQAETHRVLDETPW